MNLTYSSEQVMLRDSAFRFVAAEYDYATRQKASQTVDGFSRATWQQLAEMGWLGLTIPEDDGGFGGNDVDLAIVMEALGSVLAVEPYLATVVLGAGAIDRLGVANQRDALAKVAAGELLLAFAHGETSSLQDVGTIETTATPIDGTGWRLNGAKSMVLGCVAADQIIVSAKLAAGGLGLFVIASTAAGLSLDGYRMTDGRSAADIKIDGVVVGTDALLGGGADTGPVIEALLDRAIGASCADIVGGLDALLRDTASYVGSRVQFGKPIGRFQVIQHRLAEMRVMCEEARAATLLSILRSGASPAERARAASTAKSKVGRAARYVAHQAVQLHGGMGVSDELSVGTYLKHVIVFELMFGGSDQHARRYQDLLLSGRIEADQGLVGVEVSGVHSGMGMNLDLSPEERTFRADICRYLDEELPDATKRAVAVNVAAMFEYDVSHPWHLRLYEKGWAAPDWPVEYGGAAWTPMQRYLWRLESWRAGAPVISQLGMRLVAPTLLHFGTEAQKRRFLPGILSGDDYWCQGFSEPGAGSDLAALSCAAALDGDDYVVNGTKLWQTHAHFADWMILLVRTSTAGRPQEGITCLLVDMKSEGLSVRPILSIGGDHEVNQVFLDNVRVPAANRVGEDGAGWAIAKNLLAVERSGSGNAAARLRSNLKLALELIDAHPSVRKDAVLMARLVKCSIDIDTIEMMELQTLASLGHGADPGIAPSIIKLRSTIVEQALNELAVSLTGEGALRWDERRPLHGLDEDQDVLELRAIVPRYLNGRVRTIFGGSSEVQLGIIAKSLEA